MSWAKLSPTFGSCGLALIGALVRSVCDNVCSAFKDIFNLTVLQGSCYAEWLLPHRPETAPPRSVTAAHRSCWSHVIVSIILLALIVAAGGGGDLILQRRLQSRPPCALYRRFRRCSDSVSDTLTGQAVVPPIASRSRGAGGTGPGAARGCPGEVRREAHLSSIPKQQRQTAGRLWHISCRRH